MAKTPRRTKRKRPYRSKRVKHTRKRTRMSRKRTRRRKQRGAGEGVRSLFVKTKKIIKVEPASVITSSQGPYVNVNVKGKDGAVALWSGHKWNQEYSNNKRYLRVLQGTESQTESTTDGMTVDQIVDETGVLLGSFGEFGQRPLDHGCLYYAIEAVTPNIEDEDLYVVKIKEIKSRGLMVEAHLYLDNYYPGDIGEIAPGQICDIIEVSLVYKPNIKLGRGNNYSVEIKSGGSDSTVFLVGRNKCVVKEYALKSSKKTESDVLNEFKQLMEISEYSAILPEIYEHPHKNLSAITNHIVKRVDLNRCIVMEYLQDITGSDMINPGPLLTFVDGLNALHASDCYHLDIKPDNLKIRKNTDNTYTFVLIDFDQSQVGHTVVVGGGTPPYAYFYYNAGHVASSETFKCQDYFGFIQTLCTFFLDVNGKTSLLARFIAPYFAYKFGWVTLSDIMDSLEGTAEFTPEELTFIKTYALPPFFKDGETIRAETELSPMYCDWFLGTYRVMIDVFCHKMTDMHPPPPTPLPPPPTPPPPPPTPLLPPGSKRGRDDEIVVTGVRVE